MQFYRSPWEQAPRQTLAGTTLFAIGDVHGCAAQLDALVAFLRPAIAAAHTAGRACELVMLGDYIDRGPDSLGVLRRLPTLAAALDVPVHLVRGNHDQFLADMLEPARASETLAKWLDYGGGTVLAELGIVPDDLDATVVSAAIRQRLDHEAVSVLAALKPWQRVGDYVFVHAGIDPSRPLHEQRLVDCLWIRKPFLEAESWRHAFAVVHGHTPCGPEVRSFRIAVDSRCYANGVLTAVELTDDRLRFHAVRGPEKPGAVDPLVRDPGRIFTEVTIAD